MTMKGFTLIETMVSIAILTIAVAGPLFSASRAIVAAEIARDQLTASHLAQEGIEHVRMMRDDEYLTALHSNPSTASSVAWTNFLTGSDAASITQCRAPNLCTLDPVQNSVSPLVPCQNNICSQLYVLSNGVYTQQSSGATKTAFTRTIQVVDASPNGTTDVRIISAVSWSFHETLYSVSITDHLTPWQ